MIPSSDVRNVHRIQNRSCIESKLKIKANTYKSIENILQKISQEIKLKKNTHSYILFSPAAASFDRFKNFEERGNYFNYLIKKLQLIKKINA